MSANDFTYRPLRWPIVLGAVAIVAGLAMLIAAAWGFRHAGRIASVDALQTAPSAVETRTAAPEPPFIITPPAAMHLADMRALFKLAAEKRLALGPIEYRTEANRPARVLIKHMVIRVDDDYSKLKSFVADLLRSTPHAQLEEIQIEQAAGPQPVSKVQATIKLSLVYRSDEPEPSPKRAVAGS